MQDIQTGSLTIQLLPGKTPETRIVKIDGPMAFPYVFPLHTDLRRENTPVTILDLSGVSYMDSAGLGVLIDYHVSCKKNGRKLILAGVNSHVGELIELTNTVKLLTIVPSVADAEPGF